jgi:hypothetical protein
VDKWGSRLLLTVSALQYLYVWDFGAEDIGDLLEAFELRGAVVLLPVVSARALRFGGILDDGRENCDYRIYQGMK